MKYEVKEARIVLKEGNTLYYQDPLRSPEEIAAVIGNEIRNLDREAMVVINIDSPCHVISYNVVAVGDVNSCGTVIANVFKTAIIQNAAGIIMMHNHPSGSLQPSESDLIITKRIKRAGDILGIKLADHIIVGPCRPDYLSLLEAGYMDDLEDE